MVGLAQALLIVSENIWNLLVLRLFWPYSCEWPVQFYFKVLIDLLRNYRFMNVPRIKIRIGFNGLGLLGGTHDQLGGGPPFAVLIF